MAWKTIEVNKQNVEVEKGNAVLIKMPHKSNYKGYCFWHPSKLVREGKHSFALSLSYTSDFSFVLKKYGNGKTNKFTVLDTKEIDSVDFEKAFETTNDNIRTPKRDKSYLIVDEPKKIKKKVEVPVCLKNN